MPERTRCRASPHARSGKPTMTNAGSPVSRTSASTSTRRGSRPTSACVMARASTHRSYAANRHVSVETSSQNAFDKVFLPTDDRGPPRRGGDMRFSLYSELQLHEGKTAEKLYGEVLEQIENADRLGYYAYAAIEHFFFPKFSVSTNPTALFAAAAQKTK